MCITRIMGLGLLAATFALTGCNNSMKEQNAMLLEENEGLRAQLADRRAALDSAEHAARQQEMEAIRLRRELEEARRTQVTPAATGPRTGFEGIEGVSGTIGAGEITATVASDVLFDSGRATIKPAAQRSLDQVAQVLNSTHGGRSIRIAGHTDTDPIRRSGHKSNYHLGFERAYAVREYLISRGVAANRIYLASHGPDRPSGSKDQSRRVEIVVVMNR